MFKYVDEMLDKIDKATGDEKLSLMKEHGGSHPLNMIFSLNCDELVNLAVPSGVPPYKRDESVHPDTCQTTLQQQLKRLLSIVKGKSEHIPAMQREFIFIQVLEGIPYKEADVLLFAKDKALHELYPTLTHEFICSVFPAYCRKKDK